MDSAPESEPTHHLRSLLHLHLLYNYQVLQYGELYSRFY